MAGGGAQRARVSPSDVAGVPQVLGAGVGWPRVRLRSSRGSEASGSVNRGRLGCVCVCVCVCGLLGLRLPSQGNINLAIVLGVPVPRSYLAFLLGCTGGCACLHSWDLF